MELTRQKIMEARSYLPMAEKRAFVERAAAKCVNLVRVGAQDGGKKHDVSLPDMYMENTERKARFLLGALMKRYLKIDFDGAEGDEDLLSWDDYDRFAGSHILNQIERMKANKEIRDKCFDILQDYRALEKMMNTEVYGILQVQNDPVTRFLAYLQMSMTPESIQKMQEEAESLRKEILDYQKGREVVSEEG